MDDAAVLSSSVIVWPVSCERNRYTHRQMRPVPAPEYFPYVPQHRAGITECVRSTGIFGSALTSYWRHGYHHENTELWHMARRGFCIIF